MPKVFSTEKIGWAGTRHIKGVYWRFGFDSSEFSQNSKMSVQNKATMNAPWVCYIHAITMPCSHWCTHALTIGMAMVLYLHIGVGLRVARFNRQAMREA